MSTSEKVDYLLDEMVGRQNSSLEVRMFKSALINHWNMRSTS
jgi:hypothetical protein